MKKNQSKVSVSTVILILIFVAGLSLLLYPSFSNWYNRRIFNTNIRDYTRQVSTADTSQLDELLEEADRYNVEHAASGNVFHSLPEEAMQRYNAMLNIGDREMSMMGYITISKINESLPIYHSTNEAVLSAGIGHLEGTSLPVGGKSTHTVLSGHRGLPSSRLFTDLDRLTEGDTFALEIFGRTLTYEVDQINIVLPEDLTFLSIEPGEDYCTLVTCTPYGVNTHRLLVRGHRIDTINGEKPRVIADAIQIRPVQVAPFVAAPILLILLILLFTAKSDPDDFDDDQDKGGIFRA